MTTNKPGVKRYKLEYGYDSMMRKFNRMQESEGGVYVRFDDYEALQAENEALRERVAELDMALRIADKQVRLRQKHAPVDTLEVQESLRFTKAALSDHGAGAFVLRKQAEAIGAMCSQWQDESQWIINEGHKRWQKFYAKEGLDYAQHLHTQADELERQSEGGSES